MGFYDELESAMSDLEDETSHQKIKLVIEGEWNNLWGELTIGEEENSETHHSCAADSIMSCIIEMVRIMHESRGSNS